MSDKGSDRTCKHCGSKFVPRRYWQRFCSSGCKLDYHATRRKRAYELLKEKEKESE